jgi:hypothetical protein
MLRITGVVALWGESSMVRAINLSSVFAKYTTPGMNNSMIASIHSG